MIHSLFLGITLALASCFAAADEAAGTITILEGKAHVTRRLERLTAVEGVRLTAGDILETADSAFAQVEFSNRFVIQFGPSTRVLIQSGRSRGKPERFVYVLTGWSKVTNAAGDPPDQNAFDVRAPLFELPAEAGVVVFSTAPAEATVFAERGQCKLAERNVKGAAARIELKAGQYYQRKAGASGSVLKAPPKEFVQQMPRHFRDSLPLRIDKFRGREIEPKDPSPFVYADVEPWLKAEPAIRRQFVQRWRAKARDAAFRSALVANLSSHPEWDPVLFPEKYLPKEPPKSPAPAANPGQPTQTQVRQ